jgi:lysophospholipase L1-like esterase
MPRALILGDSHVDANGFGKTLEAALQAKGYTVVRFGVGATAARSWLAGPVTRKGLGAYRSLTEAANAGPYDLALIVLGTNDAANTYRASIEGGPSMDRGIPVAAQQIKQVAGSIPSRVTWWIGPPAMGDSVVYYNNASVDSLWNTAAPLFAPYAFDSRAITAPHARTKGASDGVHYYGTAATQWAQAVAERVTAPSFLPMGVLGGAATGSTLYWLLAGVVALVAVLGLRGRDASEE